VLWSAGICYFVALILFRAMRLGERPFYEGGGVTRAAWLSIGGAFFAAGLLAVAIPYNEEKLIAGDPALLEGAVGCDLGIELKRVDLWIREGDGFRFGSHVEGFGSLGNRQEDVLDESLVSGRYRVRYGQRRKGFAATIEQPAELLVPNRSPGKVKVEVGEGSVNVELFTGEWDWTIEVEDGDLVLWLPADLGVKIVRESIGGDVINGIQELGWSEEKERWKRGEDPQVRVKVNVGGNLEIKALPK
jgi:hypothetical protein